MPEGETIKIISTTHPLYSAQRTKIYVKMLHQTNGFLKFVISMFNSKKTLMLSKRYIHFLISLVFMIIGGCTNNDEDERIQNFKKNTEQASLLIQDIMYRNTTPSSLRGEHEQERFKVVHISDMHLSNWTKDNHYSSPTNLKEAVEFSNLSELRINALVATGDFIGNNESTDRANAIQTATGV